MTRPYDLSPLWSRSVKVLADLKASLQHSTLLLLDEPPIERTDIEEDEESRLKTALKSRSGPRQPVLSRVRQRLQVKQAQRRLWQRYAFAIAFSLGLTGSITANLFIQEKITLGGVPYRVINKFWADQQARDAYFAADKDGLHARLQTLGVEEDIKDYYRDRFDTEYELDRHIHQIMFDRTGYVGEAYEVNEYGRLVSVKYRSVDF